MVVMNTATGCVLGEPDFTPPEPTRPQLQARFPALTEIRPQFKTDSESFAPIRFDVSVLSEDAGVPIYAVLLLNYGKRNPFDARTPYENDLVSVNVPPGTLSEGFRDFNIPYIPSLGNVTHKCDVITMLVTRERFGTSPYAECPADLSMSATLTWYIPICDTLGNCNAQDCVGEPEGGFVYCPDDPAAALEEGTP